MPKAKGHPWIRRVLKSGMSALTPITTRRADIVDVRYVPIVLQKSKVAELRIFRKKTKQEAIADSYNLSRVTEVACEFSVGR